MSPDEMKFWAMVGFQAANLFISGGLWLYVRYGERAREVDKALQDLGTRVTAVEHSRAGLLRHDDLENLFARLNGISRELSQLVGQFEAISEAAAKGAEAHAQMSSLRGTLDMINRYLLDAKK